jgi:multiple sugar transport system substrate-binding protein
VVQLQRHHQGWRDADSLDGKPYGIPYDGEVTVQVYRKDLYDAKGLKPADTYEQLTSNAKALNDPANRVYGLALRGFAERDRTCTSTRQLFRGFGGNWGSGNAIVVNSPEAVPR